MAHFEILLLSLEIYLVRKCMMSAPKYIFYFIISSCHFNTKQEITREIVIY